MIASLQWRLSKPDVFSPRNIHSALDLERARLQTNVA
jgi:hypothetical protein